MLLAAHGTTANKTRVTEPLTKEQLITTGDSESFQRFIADVRKSLPTAVVFLPGDLNILFQYQKIMKNKLQIATHCS